MGYPKSLLAVSMAMAMMTANDRTDNDNSQYIGNSHRYKYKPIRHIEPNSDKQAKAEAKRMRKYQKCVCTKEE
jgi:hypothetical protein